MSMFTLAISCLTTSNLPWFMDLTFQISFHIALYNIRLYFHHLSHPQLGVVFALVPSLHSFWSYFSTLLQLHIGHLPTWGFHLSVSYLFALFILFMGFSRQEYWSGLSFPSPVDYTLSELSTTTCPSWLALHGIFHSFIALDKAVVHVISLVSFLWLWFSFCLPSDGDAYGIFLIEEIDWGGNCVLFWWVGPCSVNL